MYLHRKFKDVKCIRLVPDIVGLTGNALLRKHCRVLLWWKQLSPPTQRDGIGSCDFPIKFFE